MDNQQIAKENQQFPQKNAAAHNFSYYYQEILDFLPKTWRKIFNEINRRDR